jgi:hypothetical protein
MYNKHRWLKIDEILLQKLYNNRVLPYLGGLIKTECMVACITILKKT